MKFVELESDMDLPECVAFEVFLSGARFYLNYRCVAGFGYESLWWYGFVPVITRWLRRKE